MLNSKSIGECFAGGYRAAVIPKSGWWQSARGGNNDSESSGKESDS